MSLVLSYALRADAADDAPADYYPLQPGIKWHHQLEFRGRTFPVVMHCAKLEVVDGVRLHRLDATSVVNAATEHLAKDAKGVYRHRYNGLEVTPPLCILRLPPKDGDSWEAEVTIGTEKSKVASKVRREERLVLGANRVTFAVDVATTVGEEKFQATSWYAAGYGMVRQEVRIRDRLMTLELEKFEDGK